MSIGRKLWRRFFYSNLDAYICFREALQKYENFKPDSNVNLSILDYNNLNQLNGVLSLFLEAFPSYGSLEAAQKELSNAKIRGDHCIIATSNDNEIMAMSWLGYESNSLLNSVGRFMQKRDDIAVIHRSYVRPSYRGKGLQKSISQFAAKAAFENGKNYVMGFAGVQNFASIRNRLKLHDEYRLIYHLRIEFPKIKLNFFPKLNAEPWKKINYP